MKACGVSRADGDVVLLELPNPPSPGPGQILVAVQAAGVGAWDRLLGGAGWDVGLHPPAALGVEGAGRVLAVGADVDEFAIGDRVLAHEAPLPGGSGFWAERVLLTAAHAAPWPSRLAPVEAAALPVNGLTRGRHWRCWDSIEVSGCWSPTEPATPVRWPFNSPRPWASR